MWPDGSVWGNLPQNGQPRSDLVSGNGFSVAAPLGLQMEGRGAELQAAIWHTLQECRLDRELPGIVSEPPEIGGNAGRVFANSKVVWWPATSFVNPAFPRQGPRSSLRLTRT